MPSHSCTPPQSTSDVSTDADNPPLDVFYGLNVVRVLSIVALLLAFSSSIVVVVSDIRAVNKFQQDPSSNDESCGYIECVHMCLFLCPVRSQSDPRIILQK